MRTAFLAHGLSKTGWRSDLVKQTIVCQPLFQFSGIQFSGIGKQNDKGPNISDILQIGQPEKLKISSECSGYF